MYNMGFQYCSKCSQKDLEQSGVIQMVSGGGLDIPGVLGHNWRSLDVLGCVWAVPGHLVLGMCWHGHPCRCWVGQAHGRSQIEVEEIREQLGGQGVLCIEVCCCMRWVVPPNHPLVGGIPCFPWVE